MLLSGPNCKLFESQIMQYVSLLARELCIRNYFLRLFVLDDTLKKVICPWNYNLICLVFLQISRCESLFTNLSYVFLQVRELVQAYESDPANIPRIRSSLNEASKDIILLVEVRQWLQQQQQQQQQRNGVQALAFLEESMRSMGADIEPKCSRA